MLDYYSRCNEECQALFLLILIFRAAAAAAALLRGGIRRRQLACQLFQRNAVDILVDHLVQPRPERQSEALLGHGAFVGHAAKARNGRYAVQKLEALGYTNLRDLGGILSWPYEIEGDFEGHF